MSFCLRTKKKKYLRKLKSLKWSSNPKQLNLIDFQYQFIEFHNQSKKYKNIINNLIKFGKKLFIKYNYSIIIFAFIFLALGLELFSYLNSLNTTYLVNFDTKYRNAYIDFLRNCIEYIKLLFWGLSLLYIYSFISFLLDSMSNKEKNSVELDALIIHSIYFLVLTATSHYTKNDLFEYSYTLTLSFLSFISILYFLSQCKYHIHEYRVHVSNYVNIFLKSVFFIIISFLIINSKYLITSYQLIGKDYSQKLKESFVKLKDKKKNDFILTVSDYIKENNISDNNIIISNTKSELYIIIKNHNR